PALAAAVSVSMTAGSFSLEATATAAFPFSNSTGLPPNLTVMKTWPELSVPHQDFTTLVFRDQMLFPVYHHPPLPGAGVVWVLKQGQLLLKAGDELGSAGQHGVVDGLGDGREG